MSLSWEEKLALGMVLLLYLVAGTMEFNDLKAMESARGTLLAEGR